MTATSTTEGLPSADWFELIVEGAPDAILVADRSRRIALVNRRAEALFGYGRSELVGQEVEILIPMRLRTGHPELVAGFFAAPQMRAMGAGRELYGLRKDGTEMPIEIGLNPITTPAGQFTLASIIDITERKRAEERFRMVVEAAPNAMIMVDRARQISLVNRSAERLFGYSRAEFMGMTLEALIPERFKDSHPGHVGAFLTAPRSRSMGAGRELFGLRKDGSEVPVEIGLNPIETPTGLLTLASIIDITERKNSEDRLRRSNEDLANMNKELDEFVYTASHDLRAPLTGVSTVAQWILEDDSTLSVVTRERLALIQSRVQRMSRLLKDIHNYARTGRTTEQSGPRLHVVELLGEIVELLQAPAGFSVHLDESLKDIAVFRSPLEQVFHNLVGNAIKHHDRVTGHITVDVVKRGGWMRFSVSDDGPGIPAEYRQSVFEMFRTLKPRDEVEGSGMGLALVQKVVTRMGGNCGTEGVDPRGVLVWFDWPAIE